MLKAEVWRYTYVIEITWLETLASRSGGLWHGGVVRVGTHPYPGNSGLVGQGKRVYLTCFAHDVAHNHTLMFDFLRSRFS